MNIYCNDTYVFTFVLSSQRKPSRCAVCDTDIITQVQLHCVSPNMMRFVFYIYLERDKESEGRPLAQHNAISHETAM